MDLRNAAGIAVGAIVVLLTACGDGGQQGTQRGSFGPELILDTVTVIGQLEGSTNYTFGDVRSVAVDDEGNVYVGDRIGAVVRAYSPQGQFIEEVAHEGQGPGELTGWPANLAFGPHGKLYVRDAVRVTVLARSRRTGVADSVVGEWRAPGYGNLTYDLSQVGADGAYYYPEGAYRLGERARRFYYVFRGGQLTSDTLEVPYYAGLEAQRSAFYRVGQSSGRMVPGLNHVPFAAIPTWALTDRGTVLSTDGASVDLLETDLKGDTVRTLALVGGQPRRILPAERADSLKALEIRIDSLPVRLSDVQNLGTGVADRRLPDVLPATLSIHVGTGGLIWVERWPTEGAGGWRFYDVYDSTGIHEATVRLRAPLTSAPPPFFGRHTVVGVIRDTQTGVDRVVTFSLAGLRK